MDFANVLKPVIDFFLGYLSLEFTFAGYTTTVGALLIWVAVAVLLIGIVRRMIG